MGSIPITRLKKPQDESPGAFFKRRRTRTQGSSLLGAKLLRRSVRREKGPPDLFLFPPHPITRSCGTGIADKKFAWERYYPQSCSLLWLASRISADRILAWGRYYPQSCSLLRLASWIFADKKLAQGCYYPHSSSPPELASRISADRMLAQGCYYPSAPKLLSHSPQKTKLFPSKRHQVSDPDP